MPVSETTGSSSRRLTVLQILPALESGGTERGVLEIAEALVTAGHRSLVISAGGRMVKELTACGSQHFEKRLGTKSPLTFRHVPWLRQFLIEQHVDVIDYHSRMPGWITLAAWKTISREQRPALVSTIHGLHSENRYTSIMCCGEHVVAVSNTVSEYVRKNFPDVSAERLHVILRGVDGTEFPRGFQPDGSWKAEFFQQFPRALNRPLLTLMGRLTRLKGHTEFLKLLASLRDRNIDAHGLIVGDSSPGKANYVAEIRSQIADLNLNDHVTLTGFRSDTKEIYAISSIVLSLSSTPESFGRTVAEALSIGTPVVGYSHGGVAEILAAQFPMGAIDFGNMDALTETVSSILQASSRPVPLANPFEKSTMLQKTVALYQSVSATHEGYSQHRAV
jgi:glycosyltransferase involved in cell wall biosynthesis